MAEYIPSPAQWVRDQVKLYESSGGTEGTPSGIPVCPSSLLPTGATAPAAFARRPSCG